MRFLTFWLVTGLTALSVAMGVLINAHFWWPLILLGPLSLVGVWDFFQAGHSLLRNYPILAHLRWAFEGIRPEIRQYLIESDQDDVPFNRDKRSLVYQRAKDILDRVPFGTELDVYEGSYGWLNHSIQTAHVNPVNLRIAVGGKGCLAPYSASILNVSAMSFGALSGSAISALNKGARLAGFVHNTGEGGISRYHRSHGGDLTWQIGTGYFGCRNDDGSFNAEQFQAQACSDQVKMIEIKLSQGAKPGHGGILPGAKVTAEIADARKVRVGEDCLSPPFHDSFRTPIEMMEFIQKLRNLAAGKPVGFKLCIGHQWEFLAICKAMLETGIQPDFIVVDGAEGGTGAAPLEFVNHVGTPLTEGLSFVNNALIGSGLRDQIKIGASGKIISAYDMAVAFALGADWCNSARGFMFALGCIQSMSCHTNRCPVGLATQNARRARALVVSDKAERVANFHRNTLDAFAELLGAVGVEHPSQLEPCHFQRRNGSFTVLSGDEAYEMLKDGELIDGTAKESWATLWAVARADSFAPA